MTSADARWDQLGLEAADLLSALIQIDTTNPPGNETLAARYLESWLGARGVVGEVAGGSPERMSYVARVEGRRPGPTLLLLGHTDVVPAEAEDWTLPPFSGALHEDYVWGRGTVDMKNYVSAQAVALTRLVAAGADFAGVIVFCAVADEEVGSPSGADWLIKNRPELVRCDYVLNEGGGEFIEAAGRRIYLLSVGEKGTAQFKLKFSGDAGHASTPLVGRNAVAELARAISALLAYEPKVHAAALPMTLVEQCVCDPGLRQRLCKPATVRAALAELNATAPEVARLVAPLYGLTFSPTVVHASGKAVNVYPSHAEVCVDCRTLPGQSPEEVRREIDAALNGIDGWELEWISVIGGNVSEVDTPLGSAIEEVVTDMVPGAAVAPTQCLAYTDSNSFRAAWPDVTAYGFLPWLTEDYATIKGRMHNKDERIAIRDLGFQAAFVERLVRELLR